MKFSNLEQTLKNQYNAARRTFKVDAAALQSPAITGLLNKSLGVNAVEIKETAGPASSGQMIVIDGKASLFGLNSTPARATFFLDSRGTPQLVLKLFVIPDKDGKWSFAQIFPQLAKTVFDDLTFAPEPAPAFVFCSSASKDSALDIAFQPGANFAGAIRPMGSPFNYLTAITGGPDTLTVVGAIEPHDYGPKINLALNQSANLTKYFPSLDMPLTLELVSEFEPDGAHKPIGLRIASSFKLGSNAVTLSSLLTAKQVGVIHFRGDFTGVKIPSPGDLAKLIGASDFADSLPEQLRSPGNISIKAIGIGIRVRSPKVTKITLELAALEEEVWEIVPGWLTLKNIKGVFTVQNPTDPERSVSMGIFAQLDVPSKKPVLQMDVNAYAPNYAFQAMLTEGTTFNLTDLLARFMPVAQEVPDIVFDNLGLSVQFAKPASIFRFDASVAVPWEIKAGKSVLFTLEQVFFQLGNYGPDGSIAGAIGGSMSIGKTDILIAAEFGKSLILKGAIPQLNLSEIAGDILENLSLPAELPDFTFSNIEVSINTKSGEFTLNGRSTSVWEIPIGVAGLSISDVSMEVRRTVDTTGKKVVSGFIGGKLHLGGAEFTLAYNFPGNLVLTANIPRLNLSAIVQDLCGGEVMRELQIPADMLSLEFTGVAVSIAPQAKTFSMSANSPLGKTAFMVKRNTAGKWGFSAAFAPAADWRFSSIASELSVMDGLNFKGTALVLVSVDDRAFALENVPTPVTVTKGLNFFAAIDMTGLGVDALLGIKSLQVYAAIGGNPANIVLEAQIVGMFKIDENAAFGDIKFRLQPSPANFSITLLGTVFAKIGKSSLQFIGGMQVQPRAAIFKATMLGTWNDPFDVKGVVIADVALDLGASFPPLLPTIGIAGSLQVGNFKGAAAVKFDSAMPSRSMIAVEFNRLFLLDVIGAFCGNAVVQSIPTEIRTTVLNIGFQDVKIYIVPQPTTIGELKFEQGFRLQGIMFFWGLRAYAYLNIDYATGIVVKGDVDEINIAGLFRLTGAQGRAKAAVDIDLRIGKSPSVDISGAIELLGLKRETVVKISDKGFYFMTSGKIFDLFECTLEASGGDFQNGGAFMIAVTMRNDLFAYLHEKATAAIKAAADEATRKLTEAQRNVDAAQAEVNKLNNNIATMRSIIEAERARDIKRFQDAQIAVNNAQNEVNKLNRDIDNMRSIIQGERNRDTGRIRDAQQAVANAQAEVDKLQNEINSTKRWISQLEADIQAKKRWLDAKPWYDKIWAGPEFAAYAAAKGAEITAMYTKIGGIEAAKHTATGVLEIAKQTLRGIEAGAKTFPIDADPRMLGLIAARETANGILEAAKLTLKGLEGAARFVPIEADPRMAGLIAARETATLGLQAAKGVLEGLKHVVGGMAQVGQFIVDVGLGGILDIRGASFRASLSAAQGGRVTMSIDLVFMKQNQQTLLLDFNFNDPLGSAQSLAKKLLPS